MKHSEAAIALITKSEGLVLKPYLCPAGKRTVGYGTTRPLGRPIILTSFTITKKQALEYLEYDVKNIDEIINALCPPISQGLFDALVDFCYNFGAGKFATSTLLKKIKANASLEEIAEQFKRWVYVNGVINEGQIRRRENEIKLFLP
jgi:lysozyme